MADDDALTDLHVAWITKEHLRDLLALRITRSHTTPATSAVRDRWAALLTWCADNSHVPEIAAFARTLDTWHDEIINTVLTSASNAGSDPAFQQTITHSNQPQSTLGNRATTSPRLTA